MKILATSDIHGFLDGLREEIKEHRPDVFVIAGDIQPCFINIDPQTWFSTRFADFLRDISGYAKHTVIIPGNHDFWLARNISAFDEFEDVYVLYDEMATLGGKKFYGTSWVPYINGKWEFEASEPSLEYKFRGIPENCDVLIAHTPPYYKHCMIDVSCDHPTERQRHFGSKSLSAAITKTKPKVLLCGHIHSGNHEEHVVKHKDGQTTKCYNVSRVNEQYNVAYPCTLIEI